MARLVEFSDGTYGIRHHYSFLKLEWLFVDLNDPKYLITRRHRWFHHCKGPLEKATQIYDNLQTKHIIVK